jgi:uncharacterized protein (TIGR03032 family)
MTQTKENLAPGTEDPSKNPLASVHTKSFTQILQGAGISLAVSTYQAGKLVLMRADGEITNTHFRPMRKPMGMAAKSDRLTVGTAFGISDLRNTPAAAGTLEPHGKHDALFLPRAEYCTGDIDIHEMAWQDNALFFVNTRFSCLCKLNPDYSFDPVWRPAFISAYDPRDRCHLNGLALRDGKIRYVSALSQTDTPGGWRQHKSDGGLVIDLQNNQVVADKLAMPHSPRWHADALWYLESGKGLLCKKNLRTGDVEEIAKLPGFTRGLDFFGNFAFVGVSQVRETAVFSGLDITKSEAVRECGVWVVDIGTGDVIGYLQFTQGVREIFSVCVLPYRYPDVLLDNEILLRRNYVVRDELLSNTELPDPEWESAEQHFERGNNFANTGQAEAAMKAFSRTLELDPGFLPARYNRALLLVKQEKWDDAKSELLEVIAMEAGHVEGLNMMGWVLFQLGDLEGAEAHLEKALKVNPSMVLARSNLQAVKEALQKAQGADLS